MAVHDLANDAAAPRGWRDESLCRQHPTRWWFGGSQSDTALAKSICADCVVRAPCLEFALARPDLLGIWAATTPTERAGLRREGRADFESSTVVIDLVPVPEAEVDPEREPDVATEPDVAGEADAAPEPHPSPMRSSSRGPRRGWRDGAVEEPAELLTPAEAARKLGVTPNTVTRWSRAGKISAIQTMGGHRRFRRAEIDRVLREANLSATDQY